METKLDGPRCPHCGEVNVVWEFRCPAQGQWYKYYCPHCGEIYEWRRIESVLWEVRT